MRIVFTMHPLMKSKEDDTLLTPAVICGCYSGKKAGKNVFGFGIGLGFLMLRAVIAVIIFVNE